MEGVLLWQVKNNISLITNTSHFPKRILNQCGRHIWALNASKQEGSEEYHYCKEEGLKMKWTFHCEAWDLCCIFITTDGFVGNMMATLLWWTNYIQFKSLNLQSAGFEENKQTVSHRKWAEVSLLHAAFAHHWFVIWYLMDCLVLRIWHWHKLHKQHHQPASQEPRQNKNNPQHLCHPFSKSAEVLGLTATAPVAFTLFVQNWSDTLLFLHTKI